MRRILNVKHDVWLIVGGLFVLISAQIVDVSSSQFLVGDDGVTIPGSPSKTGRPRSGTQRQRPLFAEVEVDLNPIIDLIGLGNGNGGSGSGSSSSDTETTETETSSSSDSESSEGEEETETTETETTSSDSEDSSSSSESGEESETTFTETETTSSESEDSSSYSDDGGEESESTNYGGQTALHFEDDDDDVLTETIVTTSTTGGGKGGKVKKLIKVKKRRGMWQPQFSQRSMRNARIRRIAAANRKKGRGTKIKVVRRQLGWERNIFTRPRPTANTGRKQLIQRRWNPVRNGKAAAKQVGLKEVGVKPPKVGTKFVKPKPERVQPKKQAVGKKKVVKAPNKVNKADTPRFKTSAKSAVAAKYLKVPIETTKLKLGLGNAFAGNSRPTRKPVRASPTRSSLAQRYRASLSSTTSRPTFVRRPVG